MSSIIGSVVMSHEWFILQGSEAMPSAEIVMIRTIIFFLRLIPSIA
jgi:hypothetical protein